MKWVDPNGTVRDFTLWIIQLKHDNQDGQIFSDEGVAFLSFYTVKRKYHVRYLTKQEGF